MIVFFDLNRAYGGFAGLPTKKFSVAFEPGNFVVASGAGRGVKHGHSSILFHPSISSLINRREGK